MYWNERDDLSRAAMYRGHLLRISTEDIDEDAGKDAPEYVLDVLTGKTIFLILSTVGGEASRVAREWRRKVASFEYAGTTHIEEYGEEVAGCKGFVDKIADWLIEELDKLDNTQLNTGLKDYIIAELRDE